MSAALILQYGLMLGILVLLFVGMIIGLGLTAHAGRNVQKSLFPWVFVAMGIGIIWSPITSQRNLSSGTLEFMATAGEYGSALWLSRMLTLVVVFITASRIIGWLYAEGRRSYPGVMLYLALILVLVTHNYLAAAFGTKPDFFHNSLYPLLLFTAAFLSAGNEQERIIRFAKNTLFFFLLIGAVTAVIRPEIAVQTGYTGLLPGIDFRYWGLGAHANSIGPLAMLFILLAWYQPYTNRPLQWLALILAIASLLLTQSKTAWAGGILALGAMALARFWIRLVSEWKSGRVTWGLIITLFSSLLGLMALVLLLVNPETERAWRAFTTTATGASLLKLTGRIDIWAMALEDWARNPLFGYGPTWGDFDYRLAIGMPAAYHAHNQFVHSMAAAGIFGLIASSLYFLLLIRYAIRGFLASRGLTAGLLAMSLTRAMTEVPLAISNWGGAEVFIQLLTFCVILYYGTRKSSVTSSDTNSLYWSRAPVPARTT